MKPAVRRVLVLKDGRHIERYGKEGEEVPRGSQWYPFVGALEKQGVQVTVGSFAPSADRRGRRPHDWWRPYLVLPSAVARLAEFDLVITWGTGGLVLSNLAAILRRDSGKIINISFANPRPGGRVTNRVRRRLYASALRLCGKTIFMTRRQMTEAISELGAQPRRVAYLPCGVDTRFFFPANGCEDTHVRSELRALPEKRYVVVSGDMLRDEQTVISTLEGTGLALVRLTQNKYTEAAWQQWVRQGKVHFPVFCNAHLTPREVRYAYQHALCLLNLVDASWQPAGWTVMTEAMACGIPVIANSGLATEELKRYCTRGGAIFIETQGLNTAETRARLQELADRAEKAQEIGMRARDLVEKHLDVENTAETAFQILHEVASEYR